MAPDVLREREAFEDWLRTLRPSQFKVGNEFNPYHPDASHVRPDYRDGWNACFMLARRAAESAASERAELLTLRLAHQEDRELIARLSHTIDRLREGDRHGA